MAKLPDKLEMDEDELQEFLKAEDEMMDYSTKVQKNFYILKERSETGGDRIRIKNIHHYFPVKERNQLCRIDHAFKVIKVEDGFYPDFIEEEGLYFVSMPFLEYFRQKVVTWNFEFNPVSFFSEDGKRIEEYCLLIPNEVDCILEGSARYDRTGRLIYFEIDEAKTGELEVFTVQGFPHLIVTDKINRIDYAGYECVRIENFFNYEEERDRLYLERNSGKRLEEALRVFEAKADAIGDYNHRFRVKRVLDKYKVQEEIRRGLKKILESHNGKQLEGSLLSDRFFVLFWSLERGIVELAQDHQEFFEQHQFAMESLTALNEMLPTLPNELVGPVKEVCLETILHYAAVESRIFDQYEAIHENQRFRWYLHRDDAKNMNPPLIYDHQNKRQREVEKNIFYVATSQSQGFNKEDLREFDFSGKDLSKIRFVGCDLRRAKFCGCILKQAAFVNCNLAGTRFEKSKLEESSFIDCRFDRTNFDEAILRGAEITGGDLLHTSFVKSDLTKVKIKLAGLNKAYFYKATLVETVLENADIWDDCVFRLCNARDAKFLGEVDNRNSVMRHCDFQKSNLMNCRFIVNSITNSRFIKSTLTNADFSGCECIFGSNFKWSYCLAVNFQFVKVEECDFTFVDLSKMKVMKNVSFSGNDFSYANLARFKFGVRGYILPNRLVNTNLSGCQMEQSDFCRSLVVKSNFKDANLKKSFIRAEQLKYNDFSSKQQMELLIFEDEP